MRLEIFCLFRDATDNNTSRLSRLSDSVYWDGKHCMFVSDGCTETELRGCFERNSGAVGAEGVQKLHFESEGSLSALEGLKSGYQVNTYDRIILAREPGSPAHERAGTAVPAEDVIREGRLRNLEELVSEVTDTWGDVSLFLERGFGICHVADGAIEGWCLSEYNSPRKCGIGIETIEEYRRHGIADAMTRAFVARCDERKLVPYWDSWSANVASVKTALKNGFKTLEEYKSALVIPGNAG